MTVQVLVGGDAAALAQQFLAAAQQFAATLNAVSTTAADLANQSVWNGSTAERFRTEQQQLAGHLHTIGPALIRTAHGALAVIQAIDRDDAAGLTAGPGGSAQTPNYASTDYTQSPTGYPANLGAKIGNDLGQLVTGIGLMILGGGGEIGGVGLDLTGFGTAIGIPTGILSAGVIVSGAGLALHGAQDLGQNLAAMSSSKSGGGGQSGGQSGGQRGGDSGTPKTKQEIADQAKKLGYNRRVPPQKAPFNSHGQQVFSDGKDYISPDATSHNQTDGWKLFNSKGQRVGTYNWDLTTEIKD